MADAYLLAVVDPDAVDDARHRLETLPSPPIATSLGFAGTLDSLLERAETYPDQTAWAKHMFLYKKPVQDLSCCKGMQWYEMDKMRVEFAIRSKKAQMILTCSWGPVEYMLAQFVSVAEKEPYAQIIEWYNEQEGFRNTFTQRRKSKPCLVPVQVSAGLEAPGFLFGLQQWPHLFSGEIVTKKTGDGDMFWVKFKEAT